ncbi:MAG: hypothetical protein WDN26_14070 [Chitinophagaceae bacterium]
MKRTIYLLLVLFSLKATGQNVTIDYQAWNPMPRCVSSRTGTNIKMMMREDTHHGGGDDSSFSYFLYNHN